MERVRVQVGVEDVLKEMRGEGRNKEVGDVVTVALLDSGVSRHPDLRGKVVGFRDFVGRRNLMYDDNGHGTHICGIICGSGEMSGGKMKGMAPQSRLVVGKVLDKKGDGQAQHMMEGLDWILESRERFGIKVLNISVGIGEMNDKWKEKLLRQKIEEVWDAGIVVVCAAGNKGPGDGSISSVCASEKVITVGCHDGSFCQENPKRCETYSGRGKLLDRVRKPDLVAPGTNIVSCSVDYYRKGAYTKKSGTSMATPVVTGAIALLLQRFPGMSNEEVKRKLTYTADDLGLPWNQQGWGMVNVKKLLENY